jgi:hypothetical protein
MVFAKFYHRFLVGLLSQALMSFFQNLAVQIKAPFHATNFPKTHRLTVSNVQEFSREITEEFYDYTVCHKPREMPHRLIIDGFDQNNKKWHLAINLETEKIELATWPVLLGQNHSDPDQNLIKSWFPLLISFPIWGSINYLLKQSKNLTGLDLDKLVLLLKLEKQIDSKWIPVIKRAFSN